ncbi:O-acetyl-ADP-ribose deacetylase (regulator of RNase III), contains Macro domain [Tenacibaculum mesophilum]|uniref:O-acetyl-ADP-ribose deacetylase n=1 Tax=Tenacibaculum mesophilum TaxID=104268 RepID=A0AAE9MQD5_9FLAO|nr:O-acetyl-ADP-ribose deacetylase [Tenacibaculum mesophilum]AZJ33685.1 O-acetyl-ADP-ribose deacetylase [Tenacibaculum mesophilum]QFS28925.1 O-acetyl-ADP-ribose deacetylase [Tenacibaculum mesophilum]UTD16338.1 O-acetyl-ADP-ribose deacetylase [Tenacibaculum mesophilum]SHF55793.1 O-acetyl-ADP-ribose deacetylase (regulator of RNase III), contains Macro domain [Tenacibaculum mesophilum]
MTIKIIKGDITKVRVDIIVNAANSSLLGGSGVDGAIHRAGGSSILEECQQIRNKQGKCKTGEAVITTAGNLPAKKVIHTVGPVYQEGKNNEKELLANCYKNSLLLAKENNLHSIAFPCISTGIYRFPKQVAAEVALSTIKSTPILDEVIFVCFDNESYMIYKKILNDE